MHQMGEERKGTIHRDLATVTLIIQISDHIRNNKRLEEKPLELDGSRVSTSNEF
jgi:hypothetical protein